MPKLKTKTCPTCGKVSPCGNCGRNGNCDTCRRKKMVLTGILRTMVKYGLDHFLRHTLGERGQGGRVMLRRDHPHWSSGPTNWEDCTGCCADIFGILEMLDKLDFNKIIEKEGNMDKLLQFQDQMDLYGYTEDSLFND